MYIIYTHTVFVLDFRNNLVNLYINAINAYMYMYLCTFICFNSDPLILIVYIVDKVEREGIKG